MELKACTTCGLQYKWSNGFIQKITKTFLAASEERYFQQNNKIETSVNKKRPFRN